MPPALWLVLLGQGFFNLGLNTHICYGVFAPQHRFVIVKILGVDSEVFGGSNGFIQGGRFAILAPA